MRDELFKEPVNRFADFEFNREVAAVFDDMVSRSIPFYAEIQSMIVDFVSHFFQEGAAIYDLGCSTGSMIARLVARLEGNYRILGIDNAPAMLEKAEKRLKQLAPECEVTWHSTDLRELKIESAMAVIMNYTLQFIRPLYRARVIRQIYQGLNPGGIFILSEKVLDSGTHLNRLFADMYYQFKRRQGYSELEISRKRERLENVLVPYSVREQLELLHESGFRQVEIFFKWNNFASFIAIKDLP